jgi:hypothetical protein
MRLYRIRIKVLTHDKRAIVPAEPHMRNARANFCIAHRRWRKVGLLAKQLLSELPLRKKIMPQPLFIWRVAKLGCQWFGGPSYRTRASLRRRYQELPHPRSSLQPETQIPMPYALLHCPIRFASGLLVCLLLVALMNSADAETPTRLDGIMARAP